MTQAQDAHRQAGLLQGAILVGTVICGTMPMVVGPVLPMMQRHFGGVGGVDLLIPMVVTMPALMVALFALPVGVLADRVGCKRLLVLGLLLYGVAGAAPLFLSDLHAILASRAVVGLAEATVMTCGTTLIGHYFEGARRDRVIALQTTTAALSGVLLSLAGGMLGALGWRSPFTIYLLIFLLLAPAHWLLWDVRDKEARRDVAESAPVAGALLRAAVVCAVGFIGGIALVMAPIHLSFLAESAGITDVRQIGLSYAAASMGVVGGTIAFGWLVGPRTTVSGQLALCGVVGGLGLGVMGLQAGIAVLTIGAFLISFACGVMLPALVGWMIRVLPPQERARGIGALFAAEYVGNFCNPLVMSPLMQGTGSRSAAMLVCGVVLLGLVAASFAATAARRP